MYLVQLAIIILVVFAVITFSHPTEDEQQMHPNKAPFSMSSLSARARGEREYEDPDSWNKEAQAALAKKLLQKPVVSRANNIILYLGDGMGMTTVTTARILKGQQVQHVRFGEEGQLHLDTFPYSGTSKTYCVDAQVADSACSGTAYLCGVKTNTGTIGVNSDVKRGDCKAQQIQRNHVTSILEWAQKAGKSTGIVTTTRITHASPAATYVHVADREWECDADVSELGGDPIICKDIAEQLILSEPGKDIDVILGGGRSKLLPENVKDSEGTFGQRKDGQNLIDVWKFKNARINATYVESAEELQRVDPVKTDRLLGLFASSHIAYFHEQARDHDPTLTDMTEKAIQILGKNPKGFFLFVEGGRIDLAHHDNTAQKALWEAVEFDRAIQKGDEMTSDLDTLITVTADHSHSFSFAGYAERGAIITSFGGMGDDNLPYSILDYANGPGFIEFVNNTRHDLSKDNTEDIEYRQVPLVPLSWDTHGGEDVIILAKGPFAHLMSGVQQQNYIPHAIAYAACIGHGETFCGDRGFDMPYAYPSNHIVDAL